MSVAAWLWQKDYLTMPMSTLFLFNRPQDYGFAPGTGLVIQRDHVIPVDPLTTAKTATGGQFHSDGRILVLVLTDTTKKSN